MSTELERGRPVRRSRLPMTAVDCYERRQKSQDGALALAVGNGQLRIDNGQFPEVERELSTPQSAIGNPHLVLKTDD